MPKSQRLPLFLSGLILLSQAFPIPSPVRNAATGEWVSGFNLHLPPLYVVFAPFCGIADRLTLLSYHQGMVALVIIITLFFLIFKLKKGLIALVLFIGFLAWTILIPHPQARLVPADPDILLIDFHSHSSVSHDGRKSFGAEENMRWHQAQGYGAGFITDHNRVENSHKAKALSQLNWQQTGYRSLEGEEISLWKTHLVVLGNHERIDNRPYDSDPAKVPLFIQAMNKQGTPVIASLPEYWFYHWPMNFGTPKRWGPVLDGTPGKELNGVNGIEIINSAPKALDFPPSYRQQIVELCRMHHLFMTGISDSHGYGYATAVWNAMRIPGWQQMDPDLLEKAVLKTLKTKGFGAVEVLERLRYNPATTLELLITPLNDAGLYWRSLQMREVVSWIVWIWLFYALERMLKKKHG